MKYLKVKIDNNGDTGMCNILMGIDVALSVAKLTERNYIEFYMEKNIFNSGYELNIFDLYDINFPYKVINGPMEVSGVSVHHAQGTLHNCLFYLSEEPNESFTNDRNYRYDLATILGEEIITLYPERTIGTISYLFFLDDFRKKSLIDFLINTVKPKEKYTLLSIKITKEILENKPNYRSIHLRRSDFLVKDLVAKYDANNLLTVPFVNGLNKENCLSVIHTDDSKNLDFLRESGDFIIFEEHFSEHFLEMNPIEVGLVSMLVASMSQDFIGTMSSTFTSTIQKLRKYNLIPEYFRYLFSENTSVQIDSFGCVVESHFGRYTWNRRRFSTSMSEYFWYFENRECYINQYRLNRFVNISPNFLTPQEVFHMISMSTENPGKEHLGHEKRDKQVFSVRDSFVLSKIQERVAASLGYDANNLENELQFFTGEVGSEIGYHEDGLADNHISGKRIATILFYINDDYNGSILYFPNINLTVKPQSGMMISYPLLSEFSEHDKRFGHAASKVMSGKKMMCLFSLRERSVI